MTQWSNWSGRVVTRPSAIYQPQSEQDLARWIKDQTGPVRVMGAGHSFTDLGAADEGGTIVLLDKLDGVVEADWERKLATVRSGTKLYALGPSLYQYNLALNNQGDIDRQTIGGAVGTGTHGTGADLGALSSEVAGVRMITAGGDIVDVDSERDPDLIRALQVSLGACGIFTQIKLRCRNKYRLAERRWLMPLAEVLERLDELSQATRHFEFFLFPYADLAMCKSLEETDAQSREPRPVADLKAYGEKITREDRLFDILCDVVRRFPFLRGPVQRYMTSTQGEVNGRPKWSFEAFPSPRNTRFNEMEFAVPRHLGETCLQDIIKMIRSNSLNITFPIEYRLVKGDDGWISPFSGRDSATIAVHQYHKQDYEPFMRCVQDIFRSYRGRPHWGKLHWYADHEFAELYPRWEDFRQLRAEMDPAGKLLNQHLREIFRA